MVATCEERLAALEKLVGAAGIAGRGLDRSGIAVAGRDPGAIGRGVALAGRAVLVPGPVVHAPIVARIGAGVRRA